MLTATTMGWAPTWGLSDRGSCLTQEVAIRTVKQSSVAREAENGEEGEEEGAEFGEEDLFHQQVGIPGAHWGVNMHSHTPLSPAGWTPKAMLTWVATALGRVALGLSLGPPTPWPCLHWALQPRDRRG